MQLIVRSFLKWSAPPLAVAGVLVACSPSNTTVQGPPIACEDSICTAGNQCITGYNSADEEKAADPKKQTLTCRLVCNLDPKNPLDFDAKGNQLRAPADKCPANYHCSPNGVADAEAGGAAVSYCTPDRTPIAPGMGQWGTPCNPQMGAYNNNPACDSNDNFWCYAADPNDGAAICTQFQCTDDYDCRGGYWCATINTQPNATTVKNAIGQETTVCLPRAWNLWPGSYCAPCKSDADCPMNQGGPQHCVGADGNAGTEKICAAECTADSNCTLDAKCVPPAESNVTAKVCLPRATTCKGDGSFCSPCHSDADCPMGACIQAQYSTERFCSVKSGTPCTSSSKMCPTAPMGAAPAGVGCFTAGTYKDQCIGIVDFGTPAYGLAGCWTPTRK